MHGGGIVINEMTEEIGIAQFALKFHCVLKKNYKSKNHQQSLQKSA